MIKNVDHNDLCDGFEEGELTELFLNYVTLLILLIQLPAQLDYNIYGLKFNVGHFFLNSVLKLFIATRILVFSG